MIDRYNHKETSNVWSDESRFGRWLDVEIAACEALAETGKIPADAVKRIKSKAKINLPRIKELEEARWKMSGAAGILGGVISYLATKLRLK